MTRTLLITSGAYVEPELEAEFGRIPPSFLPLANKRLFVHQATAYRSIYDTILLSLPEDFEISPFDQCRLDELQIKTIPIPPGLTLGNSLVYAINLTALSHSSLSVLHGDTLIRNLPEINDDAVSVAPAPPGYRWGAVTEQKGLLTNATTLSPTSTKDGLVLSGFFSFSEASLAVQSITRQQGDFVKGLADYASQRSMRTIRNNEWLDFGHANTYYQSRRRETTEREFNTLVSARRSVTKSGRDRNKIEAEARWFELLPPALRVYTPSYLGRDPNNGSYSIEYLNQSTLADLYVFGRLSPRVWNTIFSACEEFLDKCHASGAEISCAAPGDQALYLQKTLQRLEDYARQSGTRLDQPCRFNGAWLPSLEQIAQIAAARIPEPNSNDISVSHGDLCFSNIMYDFRSEMVRVIDPRGVNSRGDPTIIGDLRYDLGKLHHSVIGLYDYIIAGYYSLKGNQPLDLQFELPTGSYLTHVQAEFQSRDYAGLSIQAAQAPAISTLLFLSMLPLHSDDPKRQRALMANGMRLFLELDRAPAT